MIITVTQEDIDAGKPRSAQNCPVALAISRATGEHPVIVGAGVAFIGPPQTMEVLALPTHATRFINTFDQSDFAVATIQPFEFELPFPEQP